jgi:hypothetical protein
MSAICSVATTIGTDPATVVTPPNSRHSSSPLMGVLDLLPPSALALLLVLSGTGAARSRSQNFIHSSVQQAELRYRMHSQQNAGGLPPKKTTRCAQLHCQSECSAKWRSRSSSHRHLHTPSVCPKSGTARLALKLPFCSGACEEQVL